MADKKISELTNITGANLADGDELVVVDASASETKAITFGEFKNALDTATGFVSITGDTMTGDLALSGADITFGDNDKAIFGAGSDLQIYHDGSDSYVHDAGTGILRLKSNGTKILMETAAGESLAEFINNGNAVLYSNSVERLRTNGTGVDITGTLTSDGLTVDGSGTVNITSSSVNTLQLTRTDVGGGTRLLMENGNDNIWRIQNDGADVFSLAYNTTTAFGIASNGDISFYEDTGTTAKFFWDASAERLGIGTSSPSHNLHISSSSGSTLALTAGVNDNAQVRFGDSSDDDAGKINYDNSTNHMALHTNASERMRIDSSGNVGIGTSSPKSFSGQTHVTVNHPSGGTNVSGYSLRVADTEYSSLITYPSNSEGLRIATVTALPMTFQTNNTERMRIDSSGNVGIGNTNPTIKLDVQSTSGVIGRIQSTSGDAQFNIAVPNANEGILAFGDASSYRASIKANTSDALTFQTGSSLTEAMRIDSSQRLLIGHTSSIAIEGGNQNLQLIGTSSNDGLSIARFNADFGPYLNFGRSGSNTIGTMTAVPNGDELGRIQWAVADGTDMNSVGASISAFTEQTAASNDVPARLVFATTSDGASSPTERMRIDSSGNLLVGHTSAFSPIGNGGSGVTATASGQLFAGHAGPPLYVNREDSDGDIAVFRKDGSTVGSIGSASSSIYVGSGDTGLLFLASGDAIRPADVSSGSSTRDNAIDLGASVARFKDLYLSGGVYLGGTGSANKLDDYEEGAWTPAINFGGGATGVTYTRQQGVYVKTGSKVFVALRINLSSKGTSSGEVRISGLPFAVADSFSDISYEYGGTWDNWSSLAVSTHPRWYLNQASREIHCINLHTASPNSSWADPMNQADFSDTTDIRISFSYKST